MGWVMSPAEIHMLKFWPLVSHHNAGESGLISQGGESLMGFLELQKEPGVYSRVTAGMSIRNSSLFIEVRNLSRYEGQLIVFFDKNHWWQVEGT